MHSISLKQWLERFYFICIPGKPGEFWGSISYQQGNWAICRMSCTWGGQCYYILYISSLRWGKLLQFILLMLEMGCIFEIDLHYKHFTLLMPYHRQATSWEVERHLWAGEFFNLKLDKKKAGLNWPSFQGHFQRNWESGLSCISGGSYGWLMINLQTIISTALWW